MREGDADDPAVRAVAARAAAAVADGACVGLGSGRAALAFVAQLAERIAREGLRVVAVPTSLGVERRARELAIPLVDLGADVELDVAVDGADEVAPNLDLLKGRGGALVRERIVAAAARTRIIAVGAGKRVRALGERGALPLEVIPFGAGVAARRLRALGLAPRVRLAEDGASPFVSDNGNWTLDCALAAPIADPAAARALERQLLGIPGVVDTGLFLGVADLVLVGHPDGRVEELRRA
jgi:ribose 5-phosphate isomerase A